MTFTIDMGWWIVPAITTLAAIVWVYQVNRHERHTYSPAPGLETIFCAAAALIVCLIVWLVWAMLT